jgi:peroxiredoxin
MNRARQSTRPIGAILTAFLVLAVACADPGGLFQAGAMAPDFRLADLAGRTVYLNAELRRPVVLTFFATWCAPCRDEIPALSALQRRIDDRVRVLCVVVDPENIDKVRSIASGLGIPYPMLLDERGRTKTAYGVTTLPVTVLIGTDGRIVSRFEALGDMEIQVLSAAVERLAGERDAS